MISCYQRGRVGKGANREEMGQGGIQPPIHCYTWWRTYPPLPPPPPHSGHHPQHRSHRHVPWWECRRSPRMRQRIYLMIAPRPPRHPPTTYAWFMPTETTWTAPPPCTFISNIHPSPLLLARVYTSHYRAISLRTYPITIDPEMTSILRPPGPSRFRVLSRSVPF